MESEVEAVARAAIEAINNHTLQARAQELLDPSIVRHDLAQLFSQQRYSVLRFTRKPLVVPRGSTVTWAMRDTFEIHTVTFTSGEKPPPFVP